LRTYVVHNEKSITSCSFEVGKILKMNLVRNDGIFLKHPIISKEKYFVVIGQIINDGIVGVFLINSEANIKAPQDYQFPLSMSDYPDILVRNSFLNCGQLFELDKIKIINEGVEIGQLTERDLELVTHTIKTSEVLSEKEKKKFGFYDNH